MRLERALWLAMRLGRRWDLALIPHSFLTQRLLRVPFRSRFSCSAERFLWRPGLGQRTIYRPNRDTDAEPFSHSRNLEPACLSACRSGASVRDTGTGLSPKESRRGEARLSRQNREKLKGERSVQEADGIPAWSAGLCDRSRRSAVTGRLRFAGQHAMAEQVCRERKGSLGARWVASRSYLPVTLIQPKVVRAKASRAASGVSHLSRTAQYFTFALSGQPPAALAATITSHSRSRAKAARFCSAGESRPSRYSSRSRRLLSP
jgi:hypothetical protein